MMSDGAKKLHGAYMGLLNGATVKDRRAAKTLHMLKGTAQAIRFLRKRAKERAAKTN